ncbi:uncharacterized protein OCT59_018669 [Rhizophagus irregularis]|uniref:uncharacterized protein n=1 Tax=Rhizophagus irregularis TaxID=588596 RepID=UPI0033313B9F|nr:hypothetical protein OCT59_018669 [Rhizophagus irregularis]
MKCSPDEDDEEIKIDLKRISDKLLHKLKVKWEVGCINVTDRFWRITIISGYILSNFLLAIFRALFSIIVFKQLNWPCLYSTIITIAEWKEITRTNPYTSQDSPLSRDILLSLYDVSFNHFLELDLFVKNGELKLSKIVMFKDVRLLKQFSSSSKPD